ncbi:DUF3300 domain-containing protein [Burkholderia sp. Ax-1719]|uniref:DUF3300 domain-containing protein n=1 Tax=Burkholderia sp. Ax-1719 TaxID=2608334 RepID=UPI0014248351|nr:DUF3300 domain-containing protein [Burkholderia sp. Ax-1719]
MRGSAAAWGVAEVVMAAILSDPGLRMTCNKGVPITGVCEICDAEKLVPPSHRVIGEQDMLHTSPSAAKRIAITVAVVVAAGVGGYVVHDRLHASGSAQVPDAAAHSAPLAQPQMDQLAAPVALYPDGLLVQALEASKHPDDVMAAAAWAKAHPDLSGQAAITAVSSMPWDASVKSLTAFPQALLTLAADPVWMRKVGQEFAAHPRNVMQSTQRLRKMARNAGALRDSQHETVIVTGDVIRIDPVNPKVIYVPTYNPAIVYGTWPYRAYPPVYAPVALGFAFGAGVTFGVGVALQTTLWSSVNWNTGAIAINYSEVNIGSTSTDINVNYNETTINQTTINQTNETTISHASEEVHSNEVNYSETTHTTDIGAGTPEELAQPTHAPDHQDSAHEHSAPAADDDGIPEHQDANETEVPAPQAHSSSHHQPEAHTHHAPEPQDNADAPAEYEHEHAPEHAPEHEHAVEHEVTREESGGDQGGGGGGGDEQE